MSNTFKDIREKTKGKWNEPLTQSALAKKLGIRQQTVAKAENGNTPSYHTVKMYHEKLGVPYSTLFGETTTMKEEYVSISQELRLSDTSINTIRNLSPDSLALLNTMLEQEYIASKLESWSKCLSRIDNIKKFSSDHAFAERELHMEKYTLSESFANFMIKYILPELF